MAVCGLGGMMVSPSCTCWSLEPGEEMSVSDGDRQEQVWPRSAGRMAGSSWDLGPLVHYV